RSHPFRHREAGSARSRARSSRCRRFRSPYQTGDNAGARSSSTAAPKPPDFLRGRFLEFAQQIAQIDPVARHGETSVRVLRPLFLGPVAVKLNAVVVGIAQIERLADAVIAGAVQRNAGF